MGKKEKNHYVPNLLLRRFASRTDEENEKAWVWCYLTGQKPFETSTRNVGFGKKFYGEAETGVEEKLISIEGRYASLLRDLDNGLDPNSVSGELREMVFLLAFRTQAFRNEFSNSLQKILEMMGGTLTKENLRLILESKWNRDSDEYLSEVLREKSWKYRMAIRLLLLIPACRSSLKEKIIETAMSSLPAVYQAAVEEYSRTGRPAQIVREAQINRLGKDVIGAPVGFQPYDWSVVLVPEGDVILGDACVISVAKSGEAGAFFRFGRHWDTVYLPISKSSYLVARSSCESEIIDRNRLNIFSAEISSVELFASKNTEYEHMLAQKIGRGDFVRSQADLEKSVVAGWKKFLSNK